MINRGAIPLIPFKHSANAVLPGTGASGVGCGPVVWLPGPRGGCPRRQGALSGGTDTRLMMGQGSLTVIFWKI